MDDTHIKVLLIEDNPGDALLIREALAEASRASFYLECVDRLSTGLEHLADREVDIVLLNLSLPDSHGIETLSIVRARAPEVPIVVLTGLDDEALAIEAVQMGAQDYLNKGQIDKNLLIRAIRYAIERHQLLVELRNLSLIDGLTGLYNRRGFLTLAQQQLKISNRTKKGIYLLYLDLDGMKSINDTLGHYEGDLALIETANILKKTFRESDIIARIGGDEFAALVIEPSNNVEFLASRLRKNIKSSNAKGSRQYKLSISMGITRYDTERHCCIETLLAKADALMYEQKRIKLKKSRSYRLL